MPSIIQGSPSTLASNSCLHSLVYESYFPDTFLHSSYDYLNLWVSIISLSIAKRNDKDLLATKLGIDYMPTLDLLKKEESWTMPINKERHSLAKFLSNILFPVTLGFSREIAWKGRSSQKKTKKLHHPLNPYKVDKWVKLHWPRKRCSAADSEPNHNYLGLCLLAWYEFLTHWAWPHILWFN